ncbi:MAG: hypothetical protein DRJ57_00315 [Thermoprotei archaeon]|nr:MAG: hypothetical protein DRJ57_00315 [Thermoprotei archaeon]
MERFVVITKEDFTELLERLLGAYQVIAPVEREGRTFLSYVSDPAEVNMEYRGTTLLPPKRFFFPEVEVLFTYRVTEGRVELYDKLEEVRGAKRVLLGVRPCDIKSLEILDKVLIGEYKDPYYAARRDGTLIVGLTCNEPDEYCFCAFTGSGPQASGGFDLLMTDLGDRYLVEIGSDRGERVVNLNLDLFKPASKDEVNEREEILKRVEAEIKRQELPDLTKVYEAFVKNFDAELWLEYGRRCLACGKCNYVCPTCRCFDVYDEPSLDKSGGKRVRVWDSCHFLSFTRVAGGKVFRSERPSRVKQRIYHKYCYGVDEIGEIECVGCGRCIKVCPASIDIREAAKRVVEL